MGSVDDSCTDIGDWALPVHPARFDFPTLCSPLLSSYLTLLQVGNLQLDSSQSGSQLTHVMGMLRRSVNCIGIHWGLAYRWFIESAKGTICHRDSASSLPPQLVERIFHISASSEPIRPDPSKCFPNSPFSLSSDSSSSFISPTARAGEDLLLGCIASGLLVGCTTSLFLLLVELALVVLGAVVVVPLLLVWRVGVRSGAGEGGYNQY